MGKPLMNLNYVWQTQVLLMIKRLLKVKQLKSVCVFQHFWVEQLQKKLQQNSNLMRV